MPSKARWAVGCSALVFAGLALTAAHASDEVDAWLDRMARAVDSLNYRGTLVHMRDGQVDTLRIIHRSDDQGIRERIYSLDGQPREILRDGNEVRTLLEDNQPLIVQGGIG